MKENKLALAALLVGLVALAFGVFGGGKTTEIIKETVRELVGATPGSDFPELTIGGVKFIAHRQAMVASNTPCALRVTSTSTIDGITLLSDGKFAGGAPTWIIGTSTIRTATGTSFYGQTVGSGLDGQNLSIRPSLAGVSGVGVASTTQGIVLRPNDWVNVNVAAPSFQSSEVSGACNFILQEL